LQKRANACLLNSVISASFGAEFSKSKVTIGKAEEFASNRKAGKELYAEQAA